MPSILLVGVLYVDAVPEQNSGRLPIKEKADEGVIVAKKLRINMLFIEKRLKDGSPLDCWDVEVNMVLRGPKVLKILFL